MDPTVPNSTEKDETGFAVIPVWLLRDPSVDRGAKTLYLLLSSRVGRDGSCWPSQQRLASEMGCSVATIQRHTKALKDLNLVLVKAQRTATGRRNIYTLLSDRFGGARVAGADEVTPPDEEGGALTGEGMGAITSDVRTTSIRTTSTQEVPLSQESVEQVPADPAGKPYTPPAEPETHPSRRMTPDWAPRPEFREDLRRQYPEVDLRECGKRFVAFNLAGGRTSFSWEAAFAAWVSGDSEKILDRRGGTDDMGTPRTQRKAPATDPERLRAEQQELIDLAVRSAQEKKGKSDG